MLDLDNLKLINDNFGHDKGDEALKLCYQCIREALKKEESCFRIGGDEFAYVYHSNGREDIAAKLRLLESLLREKARDLPYPLSVSAGYACYLPESDIDLFLYVSAKTVEVIIFDNSLDLFITKSIFFTHISCKRFTFFYHFSLSS